MVANNRPRVAGMTDLMMSAFAGDEAGVRRVLDREGRSGIDDQDADGATALSFAAMNGKSDTVRLLVEEGANTEIRKDNGKTPFVLACETLRYSAAFTLLAMGCSHDLDAVGRTSLPRERLVDFAFPVVKAASLGMVTEAIGMVRSGFDPYMAPAGGTNALQAAVLSGHAELSRLLRVADAHRTALRAIEELDGARRVERPRRVEGFLHA